METVGFVIYVVATTAAYVLLGVLVAGVILRASSAKEVTMRDCVGALFYGMVWPLTMPVIAGSWLLGAACGCALRLSGIRLRKQQ